MSTIILLQESRINPRKRPHPEDDGENDGLDRFVPKRPEIVDDEGYHSGTTAVVTVLSEDMITVANAGDSRCVASLKGTCIKNSVHGGCIVIIMCICSH